MGTSTDSLCIWRVCWQRRQASTIGGFVGAGADVLLGRHWSIGVSGGYNWMADFPETLGTRRNFSGVDVGVSIGWMWGKGHVQ